MFDVCDVCGGDNTTCTGCDGVVASGKEDDECGICDGDSTTCQGCDGVPNSGLVEDVCGQCGGDNTSCWGCDNVSNSGLVFDACGECGGDGSSCWGCDNVSNSELVFDACHVCGGDNATCTGCDGVLFSGKVFDSCGVCDGGNQAQDGCGVCYGDNTSCVGCDGIFKSGVFNDSCGVCGGDNSTCAGCDGIPYSGKVIDFCDVCGGDNTSCIGCDGVPKSGVFNDSCGVCGGDNSTCAGCDGIPYSGKVNDSCNVCGGDNTCVGCDGIPYSGKVFDFCNVCGGDNTTSECPAGYTGPQCGMLSDSCVPCGPGTYKDVIGSAACTECGFNTYNPEYGSTSSSACLPCMEHAETEEIYGHESIHACMCISGYYHDTVTSCTACIPGTFNAEINQSQCSNCSAGYYSNGPNSSTCEICPNATYSYEGSALCTQCNLNASSPQGSASIHDCQCTLGYTNTVMEQNTIPVGTVSVVADSSVPYNLRGLVMISDTQAAVFDYQNRCLKVLNIITGLFTTVAGFCAASDSRVDGTGTNARFKESYGMVISQDKTTIYIPEYKLQHTDTSCAFCSIRKVIVDGWIVSTLGCEPTHHFHGLAINSHDEIFGMSNTYDGYDHPFRISKCNPVSGVVTILYSGNNNAYCTGVGVDSNYQSGICFRPASLFVTPDDRLFVLDAHTVHSENLKTAIIKEVVSESIVFRSYYDWYSEADNEPYSALALNNEYVIMVSGYSYGKVVKMHIDTGAFTHIGNYQHWVWAIALYYGNNKLLAGYNDRKIWSMSVDTNPVEVTVGHCQACAAGTYKDVLGPQACEPCASCPVGQYRLECTTSSLGACVDCPSCGEGQYRVNCANQSTGECVACLAHGNITWYLEDADEGLTGGSSPDQSCDQICAEQNLVCDQSTLDGPIRYNNEAPALLFLEDIVRDSGYDQLSGSNGYNAVGDNNDACRIVPYFGYYSYYGYGYWFPEAREQHACTQTSQCSAIASDIALSTSYKYQRLCPCTCGANHYVNGCGGTNPGVCTPCETCPSGQYRQDCSLFHPGVCVNCTTCSTGQYLQGCSGFSAGTCVDCTTRALSCGSNTYLVNCGGTDAGTCTQCASCPSGQYRQNCVGSNPGICVDVIEGDVRLTSCAASGNCRVEIFYSGEWGSICQDSVTTTWGQAEADLACRQLGCSGGTLWNSECSFDNSCGTSGRIWLKMKDHDYCVGGESHLLDCNEGLGDQNSCTHDNDVTAKCTGLTFVESGDGTCNSCSSCPAGQEHVGCNATSAGTCEACSAGKYKVGASAQPCRACPSCPQNSTSMGCGGANVGSCVVNVTNPDAEGITTTLLGTPGQSGCPSVGDVGSAVKFQEPTAAIGLPNDLAAVADRSCQKVYFFDLNDNSLIWASSYLTYPRAFCKSLSGDVLYIVDSTHIKKVNMTADTYTIEHLASYTGKYLTGCAVTSDGATMVISHNGLHSGNGIWEVAINNPTVILIEYSGPTENYGVTLSADDSTIFFQEASWGALKKITRGDANSMTSWATTIGGKQAKSILLSADGTFAYVKTWRAIQKVPLNGGTVTILVGDENEYGHSDTPGSELFWGHTETMGYVQNGMYFLVAEEHNKVIRKVSTGLDSVRTIT